MCALPSPVLLKAEPISSTVRHHQVAKGSLRARSSVALNSARAWSARFE
jgi:hypothetical protein